MAYDAEVLADSPSFYARYSEASGHLVDDIGSLASTTEGGMTYGVTGPVTSEGSNLAVTYSGSSSRTVWADASAVDLGDTFTIELWLKRAGTGLKGLIDKGTTGGTAYCLYFTSSNFLRLSRGLGGTAIATSTATIADTNWHHVAVTKSGSTVGIYIDGTEGHTNDTAFTLVDNTNSFTVGAFADNTNNIDATVTRVALYKSALSSGRISAHIAASLGVGLGASTGMLGAIVSDIAASSHRPPWMLPQNRFGRVASPGDLFSVPYLTAPANVTVTPGVASLTLTTFAPTVSATANQTVVPATAALTLTTFAPTVAASDHKTVVPTTASLTLTTFAPTVGVSNNIVVTPGVASLTLTTFAPSVTASNHQTVVPATASLTLATFAPSVTATNHKTVVPATASLSLTTFTPTVTATANQAVVPATASLVLTTFAPTVTATAGLTVVPATAGLTLTTFAPTVTATAHKVVTPTTAALVLTTFAPTVVASDHKVVVPATAALALTAFAPTVIASDHKVVVPATASLALTTFAPLVTVEPLVLGSGGPPPRAVGIGLVPSGSASHPIPRV